VNGMTLQRLSSAIDAISQRTGQLCGFLLVLMIGLQFSTVLLRYVFGVGSVYLQEGIIYLHAFTFLAAAGYAMQKNEHVRIDIFYARFSPSTKNRVDTICTLLFVFPMTFCIWYYSWRFVRNSWRFLEGSPEGSGLPIVFIVKSFILLFCMVLIVQSISNIIKYTGKMRRSIEEST